MLSADDQRTIVTLVGKKLQSVGAAMFSFWDLEAEFPIPGIKFQPVRDLAGWPQKDDLHGIEIRVQ